MAAARNRQRGFGGWSPVVAVALGLAVTLAAGGLSAGEAAPATGGAAEKAPPPSKIAVIFLETVKSKSTQWSNYLKVMKDAAARAKDLAEAYQRLSNDKIRLEKNMSLGVGNQQDMQDRWLKVMQQVFKVETDMRQLKADTQDQLDRMAAAMMVDINRAIEQVALREKIDVVINRKDAELAATEQKNQRDEWTEITQAPDAPKADKPEETLDREMKQQMLGKLENTFVWSNDSMDITEAVVAQMLQDYKDQKYTNWRDMPSAGDDALRGGGGGGGAALPGTE